MTIFSTLFQGGGYMISSSVFAANYPIFLSSENFFLDLSCLFNIFQCFLFSLIFITRRIGKHFRIKYSTDEKNSVSNIFQLVFQQWDWRITERYSVKAQRKLLTESLRSLSLNLVKEEEGIKPTAFKRIGLFFVRWYISVLIYGLVGVGWYLVYEITERKERLEWYYHEHGSFEAEYYFLNSMDGELALALVQLFATCSVLILNNLSKPVFQFLGQFERYSEEKTTDYLTRRLLIFQFSSLAVLVHSVVNSDFPPCPGPGQPCWELNLGRQIYSLMVCQPLLSFLELVVKMIFSVFHLFFRLKRIENLVYQQIDVSDTALKLLNLQCLCWIGAAIAPPLPMLCFFMIFIHHVLLFVHLLFFSKPASKLQSLKGTKHMFMLGCFLTFIIALYCTILILSIQPSQACGPFKGLRQVLDVLNFHICLINENLFGQLRFGYTFSSYARSIIFVFISPDDLAMAIIDNYLRKK